VYWPDAAIIHHGGGSAKRGRRDQIINIIKGYLYFYKKHFRSDQLFLLKVMVSLKAYVSMVIGRMTNNRYLSETYAEVLEVVKQG
jgi:GT2 family glycosyltransferase